MENCSALEHVFNEDEMTVGQHFQDRVHIGSVSSSAVYIDGCEGNIKLKPTTHVPESSFLLRGSAGNVDTKPVQVSDGPIGNGVLKHVGRVHPPRENQLCEKTEECNDIYNDTLETDGVENPTDDCISLSKTKIPTCGNEEFSDTSIDLSEIKQETSGKEDYSAQCLQCKHTVKKCKRVWCESNMFVVHLTDFRRRASQRAGRKKAVGKLTKIVCALRNTCGGIILIHLSEQTPGDRYLGHFDEFINSIFPTVAEYGEAAIDVYQRTWLSDKDGFESSKNFVVLSVSKSACLVTADFNTRIRNDFETARPSHLCLLSLLCKDSTHNIPAPQLTPCIRGICTDPQNLHESRNIELKAFRPQQKLLESLRKNASDLARFIWSDLKLKESVTSMSKIPEGGSYYVGISERRLQSSTYESIVPTLDGFQLDIPEDELLQELWALVRNNLSVLHRDGKMDSAPDDLLKMTLHWVSPEKHVLEVGVRYFDGIVFSEKDGPRSYTIRNGRVVRMTFEEWMWKMHLTKDHFSSMFSQASC